MRSVLDFYRRNPLVLALVLVVGAPLCLLIAVTARDGFIGPVLLAAFLGLLMGLGVAWRRQRRRPGDDAA